MGHRSRGGGVVGVEQGHVEVDAVAPDGHSLPGEAAARPRLTKLVMMGTFMTMSTRWNIAAAKAGLSSLVREAGHRPQVIENRGRPVAVVVSADEYRRINEAGQASDRWQAVLALSAELRASGGTTLRIPARRPRPSPFRRKSR